MKIDYVFSGLSLVDALAFCQRRLSPQVLLLVDIGVGADIAVFPVDDLSCIDVLLGTEGL